MSQQEIIIGLILAIVVVIVAVYSLYGDVTPVKFFSAIKNGYVFFIFDGKEYKINKNRYNEFTALCLKIMTGKDLTVSYRVRYDDLKSLPILSYRDIERLHVVYGVEYAPDPMGPAYGYENLSTEMVEEAYENHIK